MTKHNIPTPPHSTVDWSTLRRSETRVLEVLVTCPWCKETRWYNASEAASRIKQGKWTGYCYKDRLLQKERKDRKHPLPSHPQVDWTNTKHIEVYGQRLTHIAITCPSCGIVHWGQRNATAHHILTNRFTGRCRECSGRARRRDWIELSPGRKIDPNKGYVILTRKAIPLDDIWLWKAMRTQTKRITEHRFVMAKALGRPLSTEELVDHMDGNKLNNDISNLRIYRRGRNEPGDTSGYGTFYHEWQMALTHISRLETKIANLTSE